MWDSQEIYLAISICIVVALLTYRLWGDWIYVISQNWRMVSFVVILGLTGTFGVIGLDNFKHDLVYSYFSKTGKDANNLEARYQIRQCKEFVQAKINGVQTVEYRTISAGPINISKISNWDFCAKTFGLNFWKYDTSIDGQDGGRLLCEAYARDTYRSRKVQNWCDTVFTPAETRTDQKV